MGLKTKSNMIHLARFDSDAEVMRLQATAILINRHPSILSSQIQSNINYFVTKVNVTKNRLPGT